MRFLPLFPAPDARTLFCVRAIIHKCKLTLSLVLLLLMVPLLSAAQQPPTGQDLDRAHVILRTIKDDLKKNYYDPAYHGMELDTRFKAADDKLKQATSLAQLFGVIAQTLSELDDSHTFFLPPGRSYRTEYGWQMEMIGDKCYVTTVKPGSDAETKGLREGDQIYSVDGIGPTRENMWKIQYMYYALRPRPGMNLFVIKPDGKQEQLEVRANVKQLKKTMDLTGAASDWWDMVRDAQNEDRLHRHRYVEGDEYFIWKMPGFDFEPEKVGGIVDKFINRKGVILDLRGNHGGYEDTLLRLLGHFFDHDVKVGDLKRRKETKTLTAKSQGGHPYAGKLIVLVDSESGSAAELFARVIQLEKRGTIIGDRSAGAVMRAKEFSHELGLDVVVPYAVSITDADVVMTDGKSLEHVGVTPDEIKLPTAADLAAKRDLVLAYAASLLGIKITPEQAGAYFPVEWRK